MIHLYPLLVPIAFAVLFWVSWRLKRVAQPLRLSLAERGEELLANPNLPETVRSYVRMLLATAFGMRAMLIASIIIFPFFALALLIWPRLWTAAEKDLLIRDPATRADFIEVYRLHDRITFANNPILFGFLHVEMAIIAPVALLGLMLFRGLAPDGDIETLFAALQRQKRNFHWPPHWLHWNAA